MHDQSGGGGLGAAATPHEKRGRGSCKNDIPEDVYGVPQILEHFDVIKKVGSGTFSSVCLAKLKEGSEKLFAIKFIVPTTHPSRTAMELSCLIDFGGKESILPVYSCVRHLDSVAIVMPYFYHDEFKNYVSDLSHMELQLYMWNLLVALRRVHAAGIIHRDVKPRNFLFNRESKQFALIDFGLAQKVSDVSSHTSSKKEKRKSNENKSSTLHSPFLGPGMDHPKKPMGAFNDENLTPKTKRASQKGKDIHIECICYNKPQVCKKCLGRPSQQACRAGTPGYRPPEVLMKYVQQTTGVMFITFISGRYPFFDSSDDLTCLRHITRLLGFETIKKAASAMGKNFLCSPAYRPCDLKLLCQRIKKSNVVSKNEKHQLDNLSTNGKPNNVNIVPNNGNYNEDTEIIDMNNYGNCDEDTEIVNHSLATTEILKSFNDTSGSTRCLAETSSTKQNGLSDLFPDSAFDLLRRMLDPNPFSRITAEEALKHAYFSGL